VPAGRLEKSATPFSSVASVSRMPGTSKLKRYSLRKAAGLPSLSATCTRSEGTIGSLSDTAFGAPYCSRNLQVCPHGVVCRVLGKHVDDHADGRGAVATERIIVTILLTAVIACDFKTTLRCELFRLSDQAFKPLKAAKRGDVGIFIELNTVQRGEILLKVVSKSDVRNAVLRAV